MNKPRLLDCFSGGGGAGMGYHLAGFEVVGVDNRPQKNYPFKFYQADALEFIAEHGHEFSVIHTSPPCQAYSDLRTITGKQYQDLVGDTRNLLMRTGKPYVIENVEGAPLQMPIVLCGVMFGLKVFRHRLFETNPWMLAPGHPKHDGSTGTHRWPYQPVNGYLQVTGNGGNFKLEDAQRAMGIDWMTKEEISQAIPPAYTKWLGERLLEAISLTV